MNTPRDELAARNLPPVGATPDNWNRRHAEIVEMFADKVYGHAPCPPCGITAEVAEQNELDLGGKALYRLIHIGFDTPGGRFMFPLKVYLPAKPSPAPAFLHIAFRPDTPDKYAPVEEIVDMGFAYASFYYQDITLDRDDGFKSGLAALYPRSYSWGKIGMWAFAASRAMDYLQTLDTIDPSRVSIVGHSRLGKTALWCAAQDERFAAAISNNSGCSGAALMRGKVGERVKEITGVFPYWFCADYAKYADREESAPFDQHMLLASIAPRAIYVASATRDEWADPKSEFLSCAAASETYRALGVGNLPMDSYPLPEQPVFSGRIGYHLRSGTHFLSRYDWRQFARFISALK